MHWWLVIARLGILTAAFLSGSASAQFYDELDTSGWFIRAGGVARYNVRATLTTIGPAILPPGVYENGFVLPDIGGTASGKTWNWGYNAGSQLAGGQLQLNRLDFTPNTTPQNIHLSEPLLGAEVVGGYRFSDVHLGKFPVRFGAELGYAYSDFSSAINFHTVGSASYRQDFFDLHGVVPPLAPYAGTATGPGPLIDLSPTPMPINSNPNSVLIGSMATTLHDFRFGPFVEIDLHRRVSVALGAGYSSVFTDSRFSYTEDVTGLPGPISQIHSANSVGKHAWHTGVYAEARVTYRITEMIGVFVAGDIKSNRSHTSSDTGQQLDINLGKTYAAKAGINFQF